MQWWYALTGGAGEGACDEHQNPRYPRGQFSGSGDSFLDQARFTSMVLTAHTHLGGDRGVQEASEMALAFVNDYPIPSEER
ncbi:hypothetical protein Mth01_26710 [Sphaerimonospora thailandensis]|uniref:Uncharacterized protein n=1 Tax=Sphaerimonospora thailandensis TaxID=795644 RepID=A0A8J3R8H5_9ACTN|nr:hypothetical protein Mth01_26710 [Sphaerimonospora thailandensis]